MPPSFVTNEKNHTVEQISALWAKTMMNSTWGAKKGEQTSGQASGAQLFASIQHYFCSMLSDASRRMKTSAYHVLIAFRQFHVTRECISESCLIHNVC